MRRSALLMLLLVTALPAAPAAAAAFRAPSCDAIVGFALAAPGVAIEVSFGKPAQAMSAGEFDQAIDVVADCADQIQAGPADQPGLLPREQKRIRLGALATLAEDLKLYRNRLRERARRADN